MSHREAGFTTTYNDIGQTETAVTGINDLSNFHVSCLFLPVFLWSPCLLSELTLDWFWSTLLHSWVEG